MTGTKSQAAAATPGSLQDSADSSGGTEVYAIHGADPEILAYAMARYSRSSLSMKQSLREISSQRAEQFLNTFYFQYGHRSIADLAHVALAVERLSLLAAITLVDEQRWDGQERSTRYQNFQKSGWYLPHLGGSKAAQAQFSEAMEKLLTVYRHASERLLDYLKHRTAKPAEMKEEHYTRTLRARAFDVARYLLPLATNTSLGQIVNARTLETQISRLLSDPHEEVRNLGERLRAAAAGAAWDVRAEAAEDLVREIETCDPELGGRARALLSRPVKVAPTLVKYSAPNQYAMTARRELEQAAAEVMGGEPMEPVSDGGMVDLLDPEPLEVEIAATLLYSACHYSYRQVSRRVAGLEGTKRAEIVALGAQGRGDHDELLRQFSSGYTLRFDILMDIGGFRDLHRHRRAVQTLQSFTSAHGFETPETIREAGLEEEYSTAMGQAHAVAGALAEEGFREDAQYVLPLGTRNRALYKMDFAEALYIAELRTAPAGHFSYRRAAWEIYQAVARKHPSLASYFRVTDVNQPADLLRR